MPSRDLLRHLARPKAAFAVLWVLCGILPAASADRVFKNDADLVAAVLPSVVNISNRRLASGEASDVPFIQDEVGAGFIVDPSGLIVTNRHVVDGAFALYVTFADGTRLPAKLVGKALNFDFAIIQIDAGRPLKAVTFGDSETLREGDHVLAIGNPLGYESSASAGIVSALHRQIGLSAYDDVIQTDATINQGNSGGPLFNMDGQVIGVNQAIRRENGGGSIGIGFAIPMVEIKFVLDRVRDDKRLRVGWLGVQGQTFTAGMGDVLKTGPGGVIVSTVTPDSPADKAGLRIGDVIRMIDRQMVTNTSSLSRLVGAAMNRTVPIEIFRDGKAAILTATLGELPQDFWSTKMDDVPKIGALRDLGFTIAAGDPPTVESVTEKSIAASAGLKKGDIIEKIYPHDVKTEADLLALFQDAMAHGVANSLVFLGGPNGARWIQFSILE